MLSTTGEVMPHLPSSLCGIPTSAEPLEMLSLAPSRVGSRSASSEHALGKLSQSSSQAWRQPSFLCRRRSDSRLRGWLGAGLDPAQAWECEDAGLFHLLASDLHQGVEVI